MLIKKKYKLNESTSFKDESRDESKNEIKREK